MIESTRELTVRQLLELPSAILQLEAESVTEGFRFLTRLIADWRNGSNRFDQPGECFLGVFDNGQLIAVGGLSCDPYVAPSVGRLRRVYVTRTSRGLKALEDLRHRLLNARLPDRGPE